MERPLPQIGRLQLKWSDLSSKWSDFNPKWSDFKQNGATSPKMERLQTKMG
ncbi:hypothetical protein QS257_05470 [Terrilactibacillus sp. S3-3]|nr:hypothetical protein QS257_05470 [Terrilactibacillus sp. S3-3]